MPNAVNYNVNAQTLALKKGNFYIGTGDVGKGPTSSTGFYNGITPPTGGYTIYLNKETGGPSIYTVTTEAQMVSLTNTIGSQSFTTSGQCLNWFATQTDKMIFNRDYEPIITSGLTYCIDAGFTPSYPTTGTTWYDVSFGGNNGTLTNGPSFITNGGGAMTCDGVDDIVTTDITIEAATNSNLQTICVWLKGGFIEGASVYSNNSFTGSDANTTGAFHLIISYDRTNRILFGQSWYGGSQTELSYNATVTPQSWNYLTMVKKFVQTYDVYYNGSLVMENCIREANISTKFNLGRWWNGQFIRSLGTSLVYNYNRALSASEILQNYNAQKSRFGL
jgi:hypothetical protein